MVRFSQQVQVCVPCKQRSQWSADLCPLYEASVDDIAVAPEGQFQSSRHHSHQHQ